MPSVTVAARLETVNMCVYHAILLTLNFTRHSRWIPRGSPTFRLPTACSANTQQEHQAVQTRAESVSIPAKTCCMFQESGLFHIHNVYDMFNPNTCIENLQFDSNCK